MKEEQATLTLKTSTFRIQSHQSFIGGVSSIFLKGQVGNYARYQTSNQRSNIHCTRSKRFILIRWRKTCLVFTVISHKWLTAVTNKSQLSREIRQHRSKDLPCFPSAGNCSQPSHKTNMSSEE